MNRTTRPAVPAAVTAGTLRSMMPSPQDETGALTVGAVAARVGVTVRTLHHWDAVGLVRPSARSAAGYRLYTEPDLARIERILIYREVDLPLEEIARLLELPAAAASASLDRLRGQLRDRAATLEQMAANVDRLLQARQSGPLLSVPEQAAIFGPGWQPEWTEEARERWGDTAHWAHYAERSAHRTSADWAQLAAEMDAVHAELASACAAGVPVDDDRALLLAERHRRAMNAFFGCDHAMHMCIARLYTDDARFAAFFDDQAEGLASWLRAAVEANARAHSQSPPNTAGAP